MTDQPVLFPLHTLPARCPICGATNTGQDRTPDCGIDTSRKAGDWLRRPNECLNTPRPETDAIPY